MKAFLLLCLLVFSPILWAMEAGEQLTDPALEKRALGLGDALRCVVCQSESINDSPAALAQDLRKLVRERIVAGMSDTQILDYVHERYGDYVLLKPPIKQATLPLWLGPWVFLAIGFGLFGWILAKNHKGRKD
jgi:cytochrome c-type biogenesis protein CcmH